MLSNAAKYAVRGTLHLAIYSREDNKLSAKIIAEELDVPTAFLAKILQQLAKNKLISSSKGPNGGFFLKESDYQNTVWDVILCIDGIDQFEECFLGLPQCNAANPCSIHDMAVDFKKKLKQQFKNKNIKEVSQEIIGGINEPPFMV